MDLLRFSTAGSVDDGKSTLIGRLLFDTKAIFEDQLDAVRRASRNPEAGAVDLSLLTDGLKAEREQGITIDVAYRYFATPRRKFIIADTPGHEQYTRNMATGASTAELAVILVDARHGVLVQSRRHTTIAHLLGIPHLVVAVNKMDLVGYDQGTFEAIRQDFESFAGRLGASGLTFIPLSALAGDNVATRSEAMPWYRGPTLLEHLETVEVGRALGQGPLRLPVQLVLRPNQDFRGFAGQLAAGVVRPGDEVMALPSGRRSRVRRIHAFGGDLPEARAPQSVTLVLEDEIDVSRGDLLAAASAPPEISRDLDADLVWMDQAPLDTSRPYLVRHTTRAVRGRVEEVLWRTDVNTLDPVPARALGLNEIGRVRLSTAQPLCADPYADNRTTGAFVLVDLETNHTVAAGMVRTARPVTGSEALVPGGRVDRAAREASHGHRAAAVWFAGLSGTGKADLARALEARLFRQGVNAYVVDAERLGLGASPELDRLADQAALAAGLLVDAGVLALFSLPGMRAAERDRVRAAAGPRRFLQVHIDTPAELTSPHGLGRVTRAETLEPPPQETYEPPADAALTLPLHRMGLDEAVERVVALLAREGLLKGAAYLDGGGI
ncbi:MAG: sulfate adenylyltransferase subunit CysN [Deferrisomatales bacterium]|nr:sulfate adenylyltransferase subunit CysN [Deferrisomatales bacterium]